MTAIRYAVVIERAGDNWSAYVPDVLGCICTGSTIVEAKRRIRDALVFHLDGLREEGMPIPMASSRVRYVDIGA